MKSSSWISVVALTVATAALTFGAQMGCGSEENTGGLLDGGGGANTGGAGGAGYPTGRTNDVLGAACDSDADCGSGLMCLTSTSAALYSGSPAHGVCTAPCVPGSFTCKALDERASCVPDSSSTGYCFEGCFLGSPAFGDPPKCHGRAEMACAPVFDLELIGARCQSDAECPAVTASDPPSVQVFLCEGRCTALSLACVPQCNSDTDCDASQYCDFASSLVVYGAGVCRANPPTGLPNGAACDPNSQSNVCRGMCLGLGTTGECSDGCTLGASVACGWEGTGPADAACLAYPGLSSGAGDAAICAELCDCDADCSNPELVCYPLPVGSSIATRYGRRGICDAPPAAGAGGAPGLDCAGTGGTGTGGAGAGGSGG